MRWTMPRFGEKKLKRKFLFWPLVIDGEGRWLEWATIQQEWWWAWSNKRWVDDSNMVKGGAE